MIVLVGICVGVLLIFIGMIIVGFVHPSGIIIKALGAGGGFLTAGGGAFFGREFSRDQKLGLYIVAAAFLIGMASL